LPSNFWTGLRQRKIAEHKGRIIVKANEKNTLKYLEAATGKMDAAIGKVFDSVSDFFSGAASASADEFPLCDSDIISVSFMIHHLLCSST